MLVSSGSGGVIGKTITFSGLNSKFVALNKSNAGVVLNNARSIAKSLMSTTLFRFYLHYCLALHPHKYRTENYPSDIRLYDRKMWSNIAAFPPLQHSSRCVELCLLELRCSSSGR